MNKIYIKENGITVACTKDTEIGYTQELNGAIYTVVDKADIINKIQNREDVSRCVTTHVTNMDCLCSGKRLSDDFIKAMKKQMRENGSINIPINMHGFNCNISCWDTSNVNSMDCMFADCLRFNQDISSWDLSKVNSMTDMFLRAVSFNQDLSGWKIGEFTMTCGMIDDAVSLLTINAPPLTGF